MTRNLTPINIFNQLRPVTIGFDNVFDHFERMMGDDHFFNGNATNYPPYNIVKTGDYTYDLELALAGFSKKDIDVAYKDGMLTVKSNHEAKLKLNKKILMAVFYTEVFLRGSFLRPLRLLMT